MTVWGILLIDFVSLVLMAWVLDLVRRGRLYVGYGVIFLAFLSSSAIMASVPRLLLAVTRILGVAFPVEPLTLLALGFLGLLQIYILSQLTILSNRLATVVQELAIERALEARAPRDTRAR
jgi:hypothetical protein